MPSDEVKFVLLGLICLAGLLSVISFVLLALGTREPPHRIRTSRQRSVAEIEFRRHARGQRGLGLFCLGLALAGGFWAAALITPSP